MSEAPSHIALIESVPVGGVEAGKRHPQPGFLFVVDLEA